MWTDVGNMVVTRLRFIQPLLIVGYPIGLQALGILLDYRLWVSYWFTGFGYSFLDAKKGSLDFAHKLAHCQ